MTGETQDRIRELENVDDPFIDEATKHTGYPYKPRETNDARDWVRSNTDDCKVCAVLIESFDAAMMGALIGGTGPFA
jgi:hypothetical protein